MESKQDSGKTNINGSIHKIEVINYNSFFIGNTLNYTKYIRNGTVKNLKVPFQLNYQSYEDCIYKSNTEDPKLD